MEVAMEGLKDLQSHLNTINQPGVATTGFASMTDRGLNSTASFLTFDYSNRAAQAFNEKDYVSLGLATVAGGFLGAVNIFTLGTGGAISNVASRGVAKASTLTANKAAGLAAEARAAKELLAEGKTILGSQVSVRTPEGLRVVDHLIQTPEGRIVAVEVKSGGAVRNGAQLAKDRAMATEGGTVIGKNAPDALRGQQITIDTIEYRY